MPDTKNKAITSSADANVDFSVALIVLHAHG